MLRRITIKVRIIRRSEYMDRKAECRQLMLAQVTKNKKRKKETKTNVSVH